MGKDALVPAVLVLGFNRPDKLEQIFRAAQAAGVTRLYVSLDGARPDRPTDQERCIAAKKLAQGQTWAKRLEINASEENLGCGLGVSRGISWFFSFEEEGIILEDDCLPALSFFPFASEMLDRFRSDERIMMISGTNLSGAEGNISAPSHEYSYFYSRHGSIWGWATWRRAWQQYDISMPTWPAAKQTGLLHALFSNMNWRLYWQRKFDGMHRGRRDTWDFAWLYTYWSQHALAVIPATNQITNIGYGPDATHTNSGGDPFLGLSSEPLAFPLRHPPLIFSDQAYDDLLRGILCPGKWRRRFRRWSKFLGSHSRTS